MATNPPPKAQRWAAVLAGSPTFWIIVIAILFSWPIVRALHAHGRLPPPLPIVGSVGDFMLVNQRGEPFGSEQLRGKIWIAQFLRSTSGEAMTEKMAELQHRTRGLGQAVHLVSFTITPGTDTHEVLAAYARHHRASRRAWTFLTGPRATVQRVLKDDFDIDLAGDLTEVPARFALIDREMRIRGYYDLREGNKLQLLLRDAGLLVNRGE